MLKFYHVNYTTYVNGVDRGANYGWKALTDEDEAKDYTILVNWENIADFYCKYAPAVPFQLYNFKRGHYLSFSDFSLFKSKTWDIAQWRHPELKIEIKVEYKEMRPSINEVLHWSNGEKAMQYLLERGINIVKEAK